MSSNLVSRAIKGECSACNERRVWKERKDRNSSGYELMGM